MKFFRKRKPSQTKDAKLSVSIPTIKHFNFSKQEEYKKYEEHIAWRLKDTRSVEEIYNAEQAVIRRLSILEKAIKQRNATIKTMETTQYCKIYQNILLKISMQNQGIYRGLEKEADIIDDFCNGCATLSCVTEHLAEYLIHARNEGLKDAIKVNDPKLIRIVVRNAIDKILPKIQIVKKAIQENNFDFHFNKKLEYDEQNFRYIQDEYIRLENTISEMLKENINDFKLSSGFTLETEPNFQHKYKIAKSPNDFSYMEGDILYLNEMESKNYFNLITNL